MSLAPKLNELSIDPHKLYLDPNNPRLFTIEDERVPLEHIKEPGVQQAVLKKLDTEKDKYKISDLVESISINGYVPEAGGYIFVRQIPGSERDYLVLEGNRRLIAILKLNDKNSGVNSAIRESLNPIVVQEIVDELDEEEIQKKISYLLGTCHHGAHKNWSPFAQARGIYRRYLKELGEDAEFEYDQDLGEKIASLLCIKESEVKERLAVYCAMQQLSDDPDIKAKKFGGIIHRYYSLIKDAVYNTKKQIQLYIPVKGVTFRLDEIAVERMANLCNFNGTVKRLENGNPPAMKNPKQWGYFDKILSDENNEKKEKNKLLVEEQHLHPEDVWAMRYAELRKITWSGWLEDVLRVTDEVPLNDFEGESRRQRIQSLKEVLDLLDEQGGAQ